MSTEQTQAMMEHHSEALAAEVMDEAALDELLSDYHEDAVFISNLGGIMRGHEAIRTIFSSAGDDTVRMVPQTPSITATRTTVVTIRVAASTAHFTRDHQTSPIPAATSAASASQMPIFVAVEDHTAFVKKKVYATSLQTIPQAIAARPSSAVSSWRRERRST